MFLAFGANEQVIGEHYQLNSLAPKRIISILRGCQRIVFQIIQSRSHSPVQVARPNTRSSRSRCRPIRRGVKSAACDVTRCFQRARGALCSNISSWGCQATRREGAKKVPRHAPAHRHASSEGSTASVASALLCSAALGGLFVGRRVKMHPHTTSRITAAKNAPSCISCMASSVAKPRRRYG